MSQYVLVIVASLLLGACGKKGAVEPLEPSAYPRTYPKPLCPDPYPPTKPMKKSEKKDCCDE